MTFQKWFNFPLPFWRCFLFRENALIVQRIRIFILSYLFIHIIATHISFLWLFRWKVFPIVINWMWWACKIIISTFIDNRKQWILVLSRQYCKTRRWNQTWLTLFVLLTFKSTYWITPKSKDIFRSISNTFERAFITYWLAMALLWILHWSLQEHLLVRKVTFFLESILALI